nr:DUF5103 domain-containing protein [uncultured Carboxylicivirga sp.]
MSIFKQLLISTFTLLPFYAQSNNPVYTATNIHTVQLHKTGWNQSSPIIQLNNQEELTLSFDDFAYDTKNYQYSITHCDANWEPSDLMQTEYINGFMPNPILDYQYSFNTTFDYIHYTLAFPNEDIQLKLSGNYIIKVFELGSEDKPVLTRPFFVSEAKVSIIPQVKYTASSTLRSSMQEIHFTIKHPSFQINNPREDIKVVLQQNGRWDNQMTHLKPLFIRDSELIYEHNREILFDGGNEYRWLDLRSTRFAPEYVESITFHDPHYHYTMYPDRNLAERKYFYHEDFNGKYYIDVREDRDPEIEGDYVYVHFKLPSKEPIFNSKVYVTGALSNWQMDNKNQMEYNALTHMYELSMLLKQGFYNYQYLVQQEGKPYADVSYFEGNYGQTENDYIIYVYYRSFTDNYDRLIGVNVTNSLKYTVGK